MKQHVLAAGLALALAGAASADDRIQISGFGQVMAGTVTKGTSFPGTSYDDEWSFKEESLFAVQVRGDLNDQWSATAQIVAEGAKDFDPEFAWAYLGWNGGNGWSAKLGRQRIPLFRYSDFLQVGYAYPWLRPPYAVYNFQFSNFDGASAGYVFGSGDWFHNIQAIGGKHESTVKIAGLPADQELATLVGASIESTYADWLTLRAGYYQADVTISAQALNPLLGALRTNGFANVASALGFDEDHGYFMGLGAEINRGNFLLISELTRNGIDDSYFADRTNFYVTAGYRFGAWTPTLTYGKRSSDARTEIIALLPNVAPLAPLRAGVTGVVLADEQDVDMVGVGLRWDMNTNVAFKADFTQYRNDGPAGGDADVLAAGVVFTF